MKSMNGLKNEKIAQEGLAKLQYARSVELILFYQILLGMKLKRIFW